MTYKSQLDGVNSVFSDMEDRLRETVTFCVCFSLLDEDAKVKYLFEHPHVLEWIDPNMEELFSFKVKNALNTIRTHEKL